MPFEQFQEEVELLEVLDEGRQLVLHNDDHNTFDWVIECLVDICQHSETQAEQCAYIVHFKGRCGVKKGPDNLIKPMKDALVDRGLSVTID